MLVNLRKAMTAAALCGTALTAMLQAPMTVHAVSAAQTELKLFPGKTEAWVNGSATPLEEAPIIVQDAMYVPVRWLAEQLGLQLQWNEAKRAVGLTTPKAYMEFALDGEEVSVNGSPVPFHEVARLSNDRLLVKLSWIADYAGFTYTYDAVGKSVAIRFIGSVGSAYKESELMEEDSQPNSKPIAKFAFDKPFYRLGEPVKIIDLSYDPDAEGLPDYHWAGKQEAYFQAGTYTVALTVKDGRGNGSEPFTRSIKVVDTPYLTQAEFPYYTKQIGDVFNYEASNLTGSSTAGQATDTSHIPVLARHPQDRPLIRGMSSAPVKESGFLYGDEVNGLARLYPGYVNGMSGKAQLSITLRNKETAKSVQVKTTRKSVPAPSIYNPARGYKTLESFMTAEALDEETTLKPGEAIVYEVSPELSPGQAFQGLYDVATDGRVEVSYVMSPPGLQVNDLGKYKQLSPSAGADVSGTFPVSEVSWQVDATAMKEPTSLTIGDNRVEPALKGVDRRSGQQAPHPGYAGVHYKIELDSESKLAVALHPQGGFFQGSLRVNGQTVQVPEAGLTAKETLLLYRSAEASKQPIVIELMATERTQLPVELIAVPLQDK